MKKKLTILIAALLVLCLAIGVTAWLLRDPVVMVVIADTGDAQVLTQVRTRGVEQTQIGKDLKRPEVSSANERWAIVTSQDEKNSPVLLHFYDLHEPSKPLYSTTGALTFARITPEGLFVYRTDALYCFDGKENHLLCELGSGLGSLQVVGNTVYFTQDDQNYACDLPSGTPYRTENVFVWYTTAVSSGGKTYKLTARSRADDENAKDIYRIVDGVETLIAENVVGPYRADPVSGTVVHRRADAEVHNAWYLSVMGESMELFVANEFFATLTTAGDVYLLYGGQLLHTRDLAAPEVLEENVVYFRILMADDGTEKLWIQTNDGKLLLHKNGKTQLIAEGVEMLYLPTEYTSYYPPDKVTTPGGVERELTETILFTRSTDLNASALYRWEDGTETKLYEDYLLYPAAIAENGDVLVRVNRRLLIVGEGRAEELEHPEGATLKFVSGIRVQGIGSTLPLGLEPYDT